MIHPPKLAGRPPVFTPFAGFSVLFDPPADRGGAPAPGTRLWTRPSAAVPDFLERLANVVASGARSFGDGWAALPPPTYHVTAWDGANDGNLDVLLPAVAGEVRRFLRGLPGSLAAPPPVLDAVIGRSALLTNELPGIELQFDGLVVSGGALLARLAPPPPARAAFGALLSARAALVEAASTGLGLGPPPPYAPHVTLGYFADDEGERAAVASLDVHERALRQALAGESLRLTSRSLYAFEDMTTFRKVARVRSRPSCADLPRG